MEIRSYNPDTDYAQLEALLKDESTFGGVYDPARDAAERLAANPESILVAEVEGELVGTVTVFENGRIAWLFRFAVKEAYEATAVPALFEKAKERIAALGHTQFEVYAPVGVEKFITRYEALGFTKGNDYTAFWQDV